jgi:hypothetical protein
MGLKEFLPGPILNAEPPRPTARPGRRCPWRGRVNCYPSTRGGPVSKNTLMVGDPATMREMVAGTLKQAGFELF